MEEIDFWNSIKNYDNEINSIFTSNSILIKKLKKINFKNKKIADFGCGIGNCFKYIKEAEIIYAIDFSKNMLTQAKSKNKNIENVSYILSNIKNCKLPKKIDIALSINSIFPQNYNEFDEFIKNILKNTKKNGEIIILLPSFESYTFYLQMLAKLKFENNNNPIQVLEEMNNIFQNTNYSPFGYINIKNKIIQKKWLKEEIEFRLNHYNFKNLEIKKLKIELKNDELKKKIPEYQRWYWLLEIKP